MMIVWTYWEGRMPGYIADCIKGIRRHCKGTTCIHRHVDGDAEFDELAGEVLHPGWKKIEDVAIRSDAIRCALLAKYGGLWLDADTACFRCPDEFVDGTPDRDMVYSTWPTNPPRVIAACLYMKEGSRVAKEWLKVVNSMIADGKAAWGSMTQKPLYELKCRYPEGCRWIPPDRILPVDIETDWPLLNGRQDPSQFVRPDTIMAMLNHSRCMAHFKRMTTLPDTERRRSPYLLHRLVQLGLGAPLGRRRSERRFKPAVKPAGRMKWSPPKLEIPPPRRLVAGLSYYADYVTSENEELQRGLEHAGWRLEFAEGRSLPEVVEETGSDTVFMTDRRDFDHWDCFGHLGLGDEHRWRDVDELPPDIFRATVFKDMMWWTDWQLEQVQKFGAHAVVVYYDPAIAVALAPWLEPLLVRTWHSVEPSYCGDVYGTSKRRRRCILSGAVDPRKAGTVRDPYPLRTRLFESAESLGADIRPHPGYNADRCDTPDYLRCLSGYKTAVCTSSQYDFALRKIIEATACGCRVVTDLTEEMPEIDANLIRVEPGIRMDDLAEIVDEAEAGWDEEIQHLHAMAARDYYDWRRRGIELDEALQDKRRTLLK